MIPVALITGFLGSGKTTLLTRLAERHRDATLFFLVNEFSRADVDGHRVRETVRDERLRVLPGGSIFCTCLVTEFIGALSSIPERVPDVEGVVIEASGMANPSVVEKMLRETKLDATFRLATIVCVVDPITFPTLVQTLPNIVAQVQAADVVLLNKVDLVTEAQVRATEDEIRRLKPGADIRRATFGDAALNLLDPHAPQGVDGEHAECADPRFARLVFDPPGPMNVDALGEALDAFGLDLYRAKGYVRGVDGETVYVDYASGRFSTSATAQVPDRCQLVLIVKGAACARAYALLDRLNEAIGS